jgi:hypothetical protein
MPLVAGPAYARVRLELARRREAVTLPRMGNIVAMPDALFAVRPAPPCPARTNRTRISAPPVQTGRASLSALPPPPPRARSHSSARRCPPRAAPSPLRAPLRAQARCLRAQKRPRPPPSLSAALRTRSRGTPALPRRARRQGPGRGRGRGAAGPRGQTWCPRSRLPRLGRRGSQRARGAPESLLLLYITCGAPASGAQTPVLRTNTGAAHSPGARPPLPLSPGAITGAAAPQRRPSWRSRPAASASPRCSPAPVRAPSGPARPRRAWTARAPTAGQNAGQNVGQTLVNGTNSSPRTRGRAGFRAARAGARLQAVVLLLQLHDLVIEKLPGEKFRLP